jgi:hypothetical protein
VLNGWSRDRLSHPRHCSWPFKSLSGRPPIGGDLKAIQHVRGALRQMGADQPVSEPVTCPFGRSANYYEAGWKGARAALRLVGMRPSRRCSDTLSCQKSAGSAGSPIKAGVREVERASRTRSQWVGGKPCAYRSPVARRSSAAPERPAEGPRGAPAASVAGRL